MNTQNPSTIWDAQNASKKQQKADSEHPLMGESWTSPLASTTRQRFFERLESDWPLPEFNEKIRSAASAYSPSMTLKTKIAVIGNEQFVAALSRISKAFLLDTENWRSAIESERPSFVLIHISWFQPDNKWRDRAIGVDGDGFWKEFCDHCKSHGVPTVAYCPEGADVARLVRPILKATSHVFAHSLIAEELSEVRNDIYSTPTFIDSTVFNPYQRQPEKWPRFWKVAPIVMGRTFSLIDSHDRSDIQELINPLLEKRFWTYEDKYDLRNNNQRLSPVERSRFLGCFREQVRAALLKNATFEIFPHQLFSDLSARDEKHLFETIATKTFPISNIKLWQNKLGAMTSRSIDEHSFRDHIERRTTDWMANFIDTHLAWRFVTEHHTYYELIELICRTIGVNIEYATPKSAMMSCIMPTMRPSLLPFAIEFYKSQLYQNRELIIVVNTDQYDTEEIAALTKSDPTIKVLYAPSSFTIGAAMNLGISHMQGDYWAKLDDDDYYSPHYLYDINLYRKHIDFDVAGKSSVFNYLEQSDTTILRSIYQRDRSVNNLAGGTFVVKRDDCAMYWSEFVRGYADVEFITRRLNEGAHVSSLDPFGYMQIRRSDERLHTWTKQASFLKPDYVSDGINLSSVFV